MAKNLRNTCPEPDCSPALRVHLLPGPASLRVCRACFELDQDATPAPELARATDPPCPPTGRAREVLLFVKQYMSENGLAPSLREIAAGIGLKFAPSSNVHILVRELADAGYLRIIPKIARGIVLTIPGERYDPPQAVTHLSRSSSQSRSSGTRRVLI